MCSQKRTNFFTLGDCVGAHTLVSQQDVTNSVLLDCSVVGFLDCCVVLCGCGFVHVVTGWAELPGLALGFTLLGVLPRTGSGHVANSGVSLFLIETKSVGQFLALVLTWLAVGILPLEIQNCFLNPLIDNFINTGKGNFHMFYFESVRGAF